MHEVFTYDTSLRSTGDAPARKVGRNGGLLRGGARPSLLGWVGLLRCRPVPTSAGTPERAELEAECRGEMMSTTAPVRARQSYRHEAFFWLGRTEFVQGLIPFVREGLDAGEAVMVAVIPEHARWIQKALGPCASQVTFVDMTELGRNPARIIPAWQAFLDKRSGIGRPARGIGEPIWPGRRPEEIAECQLHEALLNLAVDPDLPFWLLCPYDGEHLGSEVLAEAGRSHPALATVATYHGSADYRGRAHAEELFTAELPAIRGLSAETIVTNRASLQAAVEYVSLQAVSADLWSDKIMRLTNALRALTVSSLYRGADRVRINLWNHPGVLICEVADDTVNNDFLIGRRAPKQAGQDSVWQANHLCDLVQARSSKSGTTIRLHMRK